jgi:DNA-binding LytR/AlgR family response regulator
MEIKVKKIRTEETEYIEIGCWRVNERVNEIVRFIKLKDGHVEAYKDEKQYRIALSDILYVEAVDDKCFVYLTDDCYESRKRLYEFEELLPSENYLRISKSVVVNLMKIEQIRPALNGRFLCRLCNGEDVIVSRKYVPEMKEKLRGDRR